MRMQPLIKAVIVFGSLNLPAFAETGAGGKEAILAPGYGPLSFLAPSPGSYSLPRLGAAANGKTLDSSGKAVNLYDLMGDKIVLLSFIYSTCTEVNGCPLATAVFHQIQRRLAKHPEVARKLRLITLSFNPAHDTPKIMQAYGKGLASEALDWRFLTTASQEHLQPILDAYGQSLIKEFDENGRFSGSYSHILRVLLIDRALQIRNIYSVSFLHADLLINDLKTLIEADGPKPENLAAANDSPSRGTPLLYRPGDNKNAYDSTGYQTHSIALSKRVGKAADLIEFASKPPLGLPALPVDPGQAITREKIALGRKLFFDRRLSGNRTLSCAMCHIPEQGFTSNEMATSVGVEGRNVRRNAPTLYNVGYVRALFHDGRESRLEQQIWGPLLAQNEMANPSVGSVIDQLQSNQDYQKLFQAAYGESPNMLNVGNALASYQRTLNSAHSDFDRWKYAGIDGAINESAKRGFGLFTTKAGCASCHQIGEDSALFSDHEFHDTGIGYRQSMKNDPVTLRVQVAPGTFLNVDQGAIAAFSAPEQNDLGRYEITGRPKDRWKYRTPTLRNIALTAPYMHNGSLPTLREVIEFYNRGGVPHANLDPDIVALSLSDAEINDLLAFLDTLTGNNIEVLVADAFAAKVGVAE